MNKNYQDVRSIRRNILDSKMLEKFLLIVDIFNRIREDEINMNQKKKGFILLIVLWIFLTFLYYNKVIGFDNTTLSGAMFSGFILSTSILSIIRLLKLVYEGTYSVLFDERD